MKRTETALVAVMLRYISSTIIIYYHTELGYTIRKGVNVLVFVLQEETYRVNYHIFFTFIFLVFIAIA